MTIKQKIAYWARWVFFLPLAALITALITAGWVYVNKGDILDHSYWQACIYYVAQPIAFVAIAVCIPPSRHPAVPISATITAALIYTCYTYTLIHSMFALNHPELATGIPLSSTIALTIVGIAICAWYCAGKLQEYDHQSFKIQYFNLRFMTALFIILLLAYNIATVVYSEGPNGAKIDMLGRYSYHGLAWASNGGTSYYQWHGFWPFIADILLFWIGFAVLMMWWGSLEEAQTASIIGFFKSRKKGTF